MDFAQARNQMVEAQIARRGLRDLRALPVMRHAPREVVLAPKFKELAYDDGPLPIAERQAISQPYIVAAMLEAAEVHGTDKVLEVGAGSGYTAALLGRLADKVFAVEH